MRLPSWLTLLFFIVLCNGVGIVGSFAVMGEVGTWYATLLKPSFSPPNWVFAPVWTVLYTLMGVATWLMLQAKAEKHAQRNALLVFFLQLFLNGIWSPIFFGAHAVGPALLVIYAILFSIVVTMFLFHSIRPLAAYLLFPYLFWVAFASTLNSAIWFLNY